ncbi:MAG: monovalent cation/H(+) antiporter subunit G [bacterium]
MNVLAVIFLFLGLFFFFGGAVGILRFPDFYSRLHPAGKLDTAGLLFSMAGMACYTIQDFTLDSVLTAVKIMMIVVFVFLTSPTATHAIIDAGFVAGLSPWTKDKKEK